ncbi:arylmalonate decarboxylase [Duganella sp. FT135W]|uniref:Arylmalonate decarboxylase n=1 Tax=Duganella flavida TaxID=2692175 RepID=A0A6L8K8G3_9BURK|nr:arylmalonate decarboxylase [Duganella flavida]MYM22182.1 arylmalonate decarboxylase [Duganella flavida]
MTQSQWGRKIGVLTPATNVTVENELWSMRVEPATIATARIIIDAVDWTAPDGLQRFVEGVNARLPETAKRLQCKPDSLLLGISSSNLWGGLEGNRQIKASIKADTGLDMTTPVDAMLAAQHTLKFTRIGVVTPYPAVADEKIVAFFKEFGVEVVAQKSLHCTNPIEIGDVSEAVLRECLREVNVPEAQALVQLGTDLRMASVAAQAEGWLGKPTLSVNATTWWHCLRSNDIRARISGWGQLLAEH